MARRPQFLDDLGQQLMHGFAPVQMGNYAVGQPGGDEWQTCQGIESGIRLRAGFGAADWPAGRWDKAGGLRQFWHS